MAASQIKILCLVFAGMFGLTAPGYAEADKNEQHILVSLRMIGHTVLLHSGDSVSRVLPVVKEAYRYRISFEADFSFQPEELVAIIDRVVQKTGIARRYLVEAEQCETGEIVYSYEMGTSATEVVPCRGRTQPVDCYHLLFTILEPGQAIAALPTDAGPPSGPESGYYPAGILLLALFLLGGLGLYFRKKRRVPQHGRPVVSIGAYRFDMKNMELSHNSEIMVLTSKEADLLFLLHSAANHTLEREHILEAVWGDGGDYIGRTLDVFISKLRKKLSADPGVKIVNVRGIGYKLVVND